jgi:hypothetical protein
LHFASQEELDDLHVNEVDLVRSSTTLLAFSASRNRRRSGNCGAPIRPLTITVLLNWEYATALIVVSIMLGTSVTLMAVLLSDVATGRYTKGRDLALLVAAVLLENCGYRQMNSWWGCVGTVQAPSGTGGWGVMKRRGFD